MPGCVEMSRGKDVSKGIVICADNKLIFVFPIRSQIFMKLLCNSPLQSKKLLLVGMVSLFGLVHGSASISHRMVSTIVLFLGENSPKAFPGGVCLQQERLLEVREGQHWSVHALFFDFLSLLSSLVRLYKGAAMWVNPLMKCL